MKEISVNEFENIKIGQAEDPVGATGCTVFISEKGMCAGIDIRGGGPASRETPLLDPLMAANEIHAIVLGGGSAFALGTADGVMECLEERGIGLEVAVTHVPLVVQSDIFDLTVGDCKARPDKVMGYKAAAAALESPNYSDGNYGAGCGASVGKMCGIERCMKSGIGSYAVQIGELKIGAVVVVNALGDIYGQDGRKYAGVLNEDKSGFANTYELLEGSLEPKENKFADNTTIGVIMTNAKFDKADLCKIAGMGHDGYAKAIFPVHTSADGDSIYAVSLGDVAADKDTVGSLGAEVMRRAILRAVDNAESAYGLTAKRDLVF